MDVAKDLRQFQIGLEDQREVIFIYGKWLEVGEVGSSKTG
jgi:hypothetical protein